MDMKEKLQELAEAARKRIEESDGPEKLNEVKVAYLGKKGELTAILKSMKDVAPEDRPKVGQMVNETRAKIEEHLEADQKEIRRSTSRRKTESRSDRCHTAGKESKDRTSPSEQHRAGRSRAYFYRNGLRSSRRSGSGICMTTTLTKLNIPAGSSGKR